LCTNYSRYNNREEHTRKSSYLSQRQSDGYAYDDDDDTFHTILMKRLLMLPEDMQKPCNATIAGVEGRVNEQKSRINCFVAYETQKKLNCRTAWNN